MTLGTTTRGTTRRTWAAAAVVAVILAVTSLTAGAQNGGTPASETEPARCSDTPSTITGSANPDQAKSYHLFPFDVPKGTARIEIGYEWTNVDDGVIDIGVYDNRGTKGPEAFRSWAGSRQGRIDRGTAPLVIGPDRNERTVIARPVEPGTWHVELGYAAVDRPLDWRVELRCASGEQEPALTPDPVDPNVVVKNEAGWYAADFHLHGYHSSDDGPDPDEMVAKAKAAGLDIVPVTEYVTDAHWERLGPAQRDHSDVLIWPGREVITYFGHMIVLNETPNAVDYRVGHDGITANDLAMDANADGGIVQLAHPTIFPPDVFGSLCRGCFTEDVDQLDMSNFTSLEVVTEGSIAEIGGNDVPNPFVRTAVELWERKLREGHRLTAVSGSDDKSGDSYGKTKTMVYAEQLSRPAVDLAIRQGHAYVRGLGDDSPTMQLTAVAADGTEATFGDTLVTPTATLTYVVTGGNGQVLTIRQSGTEINRIPITSDDFTFTFTVTPDPLADEGPLGTFWGAEVLDTARFPGAEIPTVIANPVFLADSARAEPTERTFEKVQIPGSANATDDQTTDDADDQTNDDPASDDGTNAVPWVALVVVVLAAVLVGALVIGRRRAGTQPPSPPTDAN